MIIFRSIFLYSLFIIPSYGFDSFYVYVKNRTPETLILSSGAQVLPHAQAIFESFSLKSNHPLQQEIHVKGSIHIKNNPHQYCHVNFMTYTHLDSYSLDNFGNAHTKRFLTFIIVSKTRTHLLCHPVAAEVYPQGNTMVANGVEMTIKAAKKAHKKALKELQALHNLHPEKVPQEFRKFFPEKNPNEVQIYPKDEQHNHKP